MEYPLVFRGEAARAVSYEPLISGLCDVVLSFPDGRRLAVASSEVRTATGDPAYRDRATVRREADQLALTQLREIRAAHVADWRRPWPGAEHGKAIIGRALDGAIRDVEGRLRGGE